MPYLQYWNKKNSYSWAMSQKLPVNDFECIKNDSQINKGFIKYYNEEEYLFEVNVCLFGMIM